MLGLYMHRDSRVHRLPAGAKLGALLAIACLVMLSAEPWVLAAVALLSLGVARVARLPLTVLLGQLRPVMFVLLPIFAVQILFAGWRQALIVTGSCALLVLFATLVTLTTRVSDMTDTLQRGLAPFRVVGVNADKTGLMLTLVVRFVPLLLDLLREIRLAQRARGGERNPAALLVPLLVKTLRMADSLTEALEARGYDPR